MSVSVRVINGVYGRPVIGMPARLARMLEGSWIEQVRVNTDDRGGIPGHPHWSLAGGLAQLELDLDGYFASLGITPFCPIISIYFRIDDPRQETYIIVVTTPFSYAVYQQTA
jgi:5-hydroxyisourate hydrolase